MLLAFLNRIKNWKSKIEIGGRWDLSLIFLRFFFFFFYNLACYTYIFQRHVVQPTYRRNMLEKRKQCNSEDPSRPSWLCVNVNNSHKISDSLAYHQLVMWCNSPSTLNYSLIIFVKKNTLDTFFLIFFSPWKYFWILEGF